MAVLGRALHLLCLCGAAAGVRTSEGLDSLAAEGGAAFKISVAGEDCSGKITRGGKPVKCEVIQRLAGGRQANTQIAEIDGQRYVMKDTTDPSTVDNLRHEQKIVRKLQQSGFKQMPQYFLEFQPTRPDGAVLVMEFLQGFFDLNKGPPGETPEVREVRASAFFLALDGMYKGQVSHCDLNPGNAMFSTSDPTKAIVIDWGMAEINFGVPGTCQAMNGLPDLGYDGAAWKQVYARLGAPHTPGTLYAICGKSCDMQKKWGLLVKQAQSTVASWRAAHGQPGEGEGDASWPALPGNSGKSPELPEWPAQESKTPGSPQQDKVEPAADLTVVSTKDEAMLVKSGTLVEFDGVMGTATAPIIKGQALIFNFVPADKSPTQYGLKVYWASNNGKLKAKL